MNLSPTLLGIAVDVSGSMQSSIQNDAALSLSRLDGVGRGFETLLNDSRRLAQQYGGQADLPLRVFAYAFGLTIDPGFCDLLGMLKVARDIEHDPDFQSFFEESKRRRRAEAERKGQEMRRQASDLGGLIGLARSAGFGSIVDDITRGAEESARQRLTQEAEEGVKSDVIRYLRERMGDTTLGIGELAEMWAGSGGSFNDAGRFIFGNTPLRSCLAEVEKRFERETQRSSTNRDSLPLRDRLRGLARKGKDRHEERVLLIVSDGEPTDGDPQAIAARMRMDGIHIACAFVTDRDVQAPRKLMSHPDPRWPSGTRLMFEMASPIDPAAENLTAAASPTGSSAWRQVLEQSGWEVPQGARLFIQVNHSEILADFMRIAATTMPAKDLLRAGLLSF